LYDVGGREKGMFGTNEQVSVWKDKAIVSIREMKKRSWKTRREKEKKTTHHVVTFD